MRRILVLSAALIACLSSTFAAQRQMPAAWPYGVPELPPGEVPPQAARILPPKEFVPPPPPAKSPDELRQAAGSEFTFTQRQIGYRHGPADWFPRDHPVMPEIVAKGKNPEVRACSMCHLPNGKGRPENAPIQGLPHDYIVQQLKDFRGELRASAEPRKANTSEMQSIAQHLTDAEIEAAATYFSSMTMTPYIRVVEAETIPKVRIAGEMYLRLTDGSTEPLGNRIIETPEDTAQTQLRNPRSGYIAYVPPGSVKRGEALAGTGGDDARTTPCVICHGPGLKGSVLAPPIAGRSPSYLGRQIYDFKLGTRRGPNAGQMKPVVAGLSDSDIVDLVAYVSSLTP